MEEKMQYIFEVVVIPRKLYFRYCEEKKHLWEKNDKG